MSEVTEQTLRELIQVGIPDIHFLDIQDESSGCGSKFRLVAVSDSFQGLVS